MLRKAAPSNNDQLDVAVTTEDKMMAIVNKSKNSKKSLESQPSEKSMEQELAELEIELYNKAEELAQRTPPERFLTTFEMSEQEAKAPDDQAREFVRIMEFIQKNKKQSPTVDSSTRLKLQPNLLQIQKYSQQFKYKESELLKKQKGLQLNKAV